MRGLQHHGDDVTGPGRAAGRRVVAPDLGLQVHVAVRQRTQVERQQLRLLHVVAGHIKDELFWEPKAVNGSLIREPWRSVSGMTEQSTVAETLQLKTTAAEVRMTRAAISSTMEYFNLAF